VHPSAASSANWKLNPRGAANVERAVKGENVTRFFFARHPLDRLASAYVDKFELNNKEEHMFRGKKMGRNYLELV